MTLRTLEDGYGKDICTATVTIVAPTTSLQTSHVSCTLYDCEVKAKTSTMLPANTELSITLNPEDVIPPITVDFNRYL